MIFAILSMCWRVITSCNLKIARAGKSSVSTIDKMAKIILLTGSFVAYAYAMEFFIAWYSGDHYERFAFWNRIFGPYWWYWWFGMLFCNVLSPQLFWFRWCRHNVVVVFFVAM